MNRVWVQGALFPLYPQIYHAYEFEAMGRWWEVYDDSDTVVASLEPEDFGDFLDFARSINYDVYINTYKSWEALENA